MAEDGDENKPITRRTRRYRQRIREILRDALARAVELGEISDEGLDEPADLLFGMVLGLNIAVRVGPPSSEIEGFVFGVRYETTQWRLRVGADRREVSAVNLRAHPPTASLRARTDEGTGP